MIENLPISNENDDPASNRPLRRTSRLSILKSQTIIENETKDSEETLSSEMTESERADEDEDNDLPEVYQLGDIVWYRVPGNPWWPALVYGCYYEDYRHTRVVKCGNRGKRRSYFIYFFGPSFEFVWTKTNLFLPYQGLQEFIRHAESEVQKGTTKGEQEILANRYELRVSGRKRPQWDQAIEEADQALKLTREERIANFKEILETILKEAEDKMNNNGKKRDSSVGKRQSRKSSSSSDVSSTRSSVKGLKRKSSTPSISSFHIGLPTLTMYDEKCLIQSLLDHPDRDRLTLMEGQAFICQRVTEMIKENSHLSMSCVQIDWFYDLLIKYSSMIRPYARWFEAKFDSTIHDSVYMKQCQLKNLFKFE